MTCTTRAASWRRAGMFLAATAVLSLGGVARAGDVPRKDGADRLTASALAGLIDRAVQDRLAAEKQTPASPADDAEFLRRVYLDITGVIPPADRVAAFLDSKEPDKRARLIDALLASPDYGRHMGDIWQELLLTQRDIFSLGLPTEPLANWFAEGFNANKPWDRMVTELLTSTGTQEHNPATTFYLAVRYPDKLNDTVCRVFLGIQLQCAQCHNHPFTTWKRTDYWGMAAFFAKVDDGAPAKLLKAKNPSVREADTVRTKRLPDSAVNTAPRFLGGAAPRLDGRAPYRPVLARWLTSAENPYFARAMVNRVWAQFFGRGLVNPVDNLSEENAPSHPELFESLTRQFVRSGFDVKHLVRAICNSQAYQRSSTAAGPEGLYAAMTIKPLTPEQMYDSLARILGEGNAKKAGKGGKKAAGAGKAAKAAKRAAKGAKGAKAGKKAAKGANKRGKFKRGPRAVFVSFFRPGEGAEPNEYATGIPQVLQLMNSDWTARTSAFVSRTVKSGVAPARNLEALFLATLARRPTAAECRRLEKYLQDNPGDAAKAYGDVLWALLNSSEFTLNH